MKNHHHRAGGALAYLLALVGIAGITVAIILLLENISQRKVEARTPYVRVQEVTENDTDPALWGRTGRSSTTPTNAPP
jgi:hypothetical protein